jgi:hypothetical protein
MAEQRRFSRIAFDAQSTLSAGGTAREARLLDISMKGVLLELPREWHPARESGVQVVVKLGAGDALIRMETVVSHVEGDRLGLRCVSIDLTSVSHLRRLIELNMGEPELIERELAALI